MDRSDARQQPCKTWVLDKNGVKCFCERGPEGHPGGCFGTKSQSAYDSELKKKGKP